MLLKIYKWFKMVLILILSFCPQTYSSPFRTILLFFFASRICRRCRQRRTIFRFLCCLHSIGEKLTVSIIRNLDKWNWNYSHWILFQGNFFKDFCVKRIFSNLGWFLNDWRLLHFWQILLFGTSCNWHFCFYLFLIVW